MTRRVVNVHERRLDAPAEVVGALLDTLGQGDDRLWPNRSWPPLLLDGPVGVGATGGHVPIRYRVSAYVPGRAVTCTFADEVGIDGEHRLEVEAAPGGGCVLRHVLTGRLRGPMRWRFPLIVEPLHDALLEDLLDRAELAVTGRLARPASWDARVRWLRRVLAPRPRRTSIPDDASLAQHSTARLKVMDAWQLPRLPGMPRDPQVWADAIFRDPPPWVVTLLRIRHVLVGVVGIRPGDASAFDPVEVADHELLLGTDAGHLDFRASILVGDRRVVVTTLVRANNRRGRAYLAVIRPLHPRVIRAMLARAHRRLATPPAAGAAAPVEGASG